MNNKDHLVGQLTTQSPDLLHNAILMLRQNIYNAILMLRQNRYKLECLQNLPPYTGYTRHTKEITLVCQVFLLLQTHCHSKVTLEEEQTKTNLFGVKTQPFYCKHFLDDIFTKNLIKIQQNTL